MSGLILMARLVDRLGSRVSIDFGGLARGLVNAVRVRLGVPREVVRAEFREIPPAGQRGRRV